MAQTAVPDITPYQSRDAEATNLESPRRENHAYMPLPNIEDLKLEELSLLSAKGLGHGIDVTAENPWTSRVPNARKIVELGDIVPKEEPSAYKYYHREVVSGNDISLKGSTTLAVFDQLSMGIDTNISRSTSHSRVEVGSRIHTRTIEFVKATSAHFEDTLQEKVKFDDVRDNKDVLLKRCKEFVEECHYTHYVRAILLGAAEYEVLKVDEYKKIYSISAKIEARVQHVGAGASGGFQRIVNERRVEQKYTKIGSWNKSHQVVEEQVIDVVITPIHELIKSKSLKRALKDAVKEYREERLQEESNGPFVIKAGSETIYYWKESGGKITVTTEKTSATKFSIDIDKVKHPTEFAIQEIQDKKDGPKKRLAYHMVPGGRSQSDTPPALRDNSQQKFSLRDPTQGRGSKVNPHNWISDKNAWLYIRCSQRIGLNGKFCIKRPSPGEEFELTIVRSSCIHNPPAEVYMLFCLEKVLDAD